MQVNKIPWQRGFDYYSADCTVLSNSLRSGEGYPTWPVLAPAEVEGNQMKPRLKM
jgi:hypothetical protein